MIATITVVIATAADLHIDALRRRGACRCCDIENGRSRQQSQFLDHDNLFLPLKISRDKPLPPGKFRAKWSTSTQGPHVRAVPDSRLIRDGHSSSQGTREKLGRSPGMTQQTKNRDFDKQPKPDQKIPPAGPHDKPELTDENKTPAAASCLTGITGKSMAQRDDRNRSSCRHVSTLDIY
jgi:hypothetical protein